MERMPGKVRVDGGVGGALHAVRLTSLSPAFHTLPVVDSWRGCHSPVASTDTDVRLGGVTVEPCCRERARGDDLPAVGTGGIGGGTDECTADTLTLSLRVYLGVLDVHLGSVHREGQLTDLLVIQVRLVGRRRGSNLDTHGRFPSLRRRSARCIRQSPDR